MPLTFILPNSVLTPLEITLLCDVLRAFTLCVNVMGVTGIALLLTRVSFPEQSTLLEAFKYKATFSRWMNDIP